MTTRSITRNRLRPPPAIKAKTGVVGLPFPDKLSLGGTFMTAQNQAAPPLGALVATQAAAVKQTHDTLVQKVAERKVLEDSITVKDGEITTAVQLYDTALQDYALGAVKAADGDVIALQTLGVTPVGTTRSKISGPPKAPDKIRLLPGPAPGSLVVKHSRPAGSGSFAVEYKLEPSHPEDRWQALEALQSKAAVHHLDGLAPAQLVRVRVRALGDGWGPYSVEAVGRAQ
jgi:hypothetical protein